jgi:hypothetical protein
MADLGVMSHNTRDAATNQDAIGWVEILHGKVSLKVIKMQESYGVLARSKQTIGKWSKRLIKHLILITHYQWLFRNLTLHHETKGYLCKKAEWDIHQEISALLNKQPSDIPTA